MKEQEEQKTIDRQDELEGENSENTDEGQQQGKNLKKILLISGLTLVFLILVGILLFNYFSDSSKTKKQASDEKLEMLSKQVIFHDLDDIIVNLDTKGAGNTFLKVQLTLKIKGENNLKVVKALMPEVRDAVQVYLRGLRPKDLYGAISLYKLREEIMIRINSIIYPAEIQEVLFKEILTQ